ncbi:MAG: AI-2E family transporter [Chlamydiae bacterium]|nr:AI-2E family transporter [Chlamydiota bacterium]MBI3265639.1 AI-2E family transporter [Chlamydiota bacterium]
MSPIQREQLFRFFFLGVFLFLLYQIFHVLSPFYTGILGAIVLTLIFFPLHRLILKAMGPRHINWAATFSTSLIVIAIIIPFILLSWVLLNEVSALTPVIKHIGKTIEDWREGQMATESPWLKALQIKLNNVLDVSQVNLQKMLTEGATAIVKMILNIGKKLPRNAFVLLINILIMIFTLFFLLRDGQSLFKKAKELLPMEKKHKDQIADQLYITVTAVVRGVFIVALAQGLVAGIGFAIAGVPSPIVLAFTTTLSALIPLIGACAVWLPVCLYYLIKGSTFTWIFMAVWGFFVISLVDNFLRPLLIGSKTKLPMLFLFFGILGGIKVYGPMGFFLGPLVIALLFAFIKIYREEYR